MGKAWDVEVRKNLRMGPSFATLFIHSFTHSFIHSFTYTGIQDVLWARRRYGRELPPYRGEHETLKPPNQYFPSLNFSFLTHKIEILQRLNDMIQVISLVHTLDNEVNGSHYFCSFFFSVKLSFTLISSFNFIPQTLHNISHGFARLQARKATGAGHILISVLQKKFSKTWGWTKEKPDCVFHGVRDIIEQTF